MPCCVVKASVRACARAPTFLLGGQRWREGTAVSGCGAGLMQPRNNHAYLYFSGVIEQRWGEEEEKLLPNRVCVSVRLDMGVFADRRISTIHVLLS